MKIINFSTTLVAVLLIASNANAAWTLLTANTPARAADVLNNFKMINLGTNLLPYNASGTAVNNTYDLGSSSYAWKNAYLSGDLTVDTNTLYVKSASNNVGIGTTSPAVRLSVQNTAVDTSGIGLYRNTGDGTLLVGLAQDADGHGQLRVYDTSGSLDVKISGNGGSYFNAGNVGIGTTSPEMPLDIVSNSNAEALQLRGRSADNISELWFANNDGTNKFVLQSRPNTNYMEWKGTGQTGIAIRTDSGNVGIGTTYPQRTLSVVGDLQVTGNIYESNACYGEMYVSYNVTATSIASAGAYVTVFQGVSAGSLKNATFTNSGSEAYLTMQKAGDYMFTCSVSFSGGNSDEFHGGLSVNNGAVSGQHEFSRKMGASGDIGSASFCGIVTLAANDTIRFKITNETDADDPTIENMNFSIRRIAP